MSEATWINHSTFLIEYKGISILTDPIFSSRCSPISILGPKRYHPPGIELDYLMRLDLVLISHTHYDHLDYWSIRNILERFPEVTFIVPRGFGWWFRLLGAKHIYSCRPKESFEIHLSSVLIRIHTVPAKHLTNRYLIDMGLVASMGFVVNLDQEKTFYFVGDTAFDPSIARFAQSKGRIDLGLIPIGAYLPRILFRKMHMDPFEALQFHELTRAKQSIASHWKTFKLTWEHPNQAKVDLEKAINASSMPSNSFQTIDPGEKISW